MSSDNLKIKRRFRRIEFTRDAGVYCSIARKAAADRLINLMVVDISERGFRFTIVPGIEENFRSGETIYLTAIVGARNVQFQEPLELLIRRQYWHKNRKLIDVGCEIFYLSEQSQRQLRQFITAEMQSRGLLETTGPAAAGPNPSLLRGSQHSRKVATIFAGHRPKGNTATVLGWVEDRLKRLGHSVERVNLASKKINGCSNCLQCNSKAIENLCVQKDDGNLVLEKMAASDAVIFASPLYHKYLSSQLRALMGRLERVYRKTRMEKIGAPGAGQPQALVMTLSFPFDVHAWRCIEDFEALLRGYRAHSAGKLIVCNCSTPELLGPQIQSMAATFAENLFLPKDSPYPLLFSEVRRVDLLSRLDLEAKQQIARPEAAVS